MARGDGLEPASYEEGRKAQPVLGVGVVPKTHPRTAGDQVALRGGTPNGIRTRAAALKVSLSRVAYQGCSSNDPGQRLFYLTAVDHRRPFVTVR